MRCTRRLGAGRVMAAALLVVLGTLSLAALSAGATRPAWAATPRVTTSSGLYTSVAPTRILDTRKGLGAPQGTVPSGGTVSLTVDGVGGVPASGVAAVVLNVTVTQPSAAGFVTVYPDGTKAPNVSNLNFSAGETIPNLVVAPVGADGKVDLTNGAQGTVSLIADVSGYFSGVESGALGGVASVAADEESVCGLLDSGGVDCWGSGSDDNLGDGTASSSNRPVPVEAVGGSGTLSGVTQIASSAFGGYCALLGSGGVDCWGNNIWGELGDGSTGGSSSCGTDNPCSATPVNVVGVGGSGHLSGVTQLVSYFYGYCALLGSGGVDCWGGNPLGELGDGSTGGSACGLGACSATPMSVEGAGGSGTLSGVESLSSSPQGDTLCALLSSQGAECWGNNDEGELGNGLSLSTTGSGTCGGHNNTCADYPTTVVGTSGSGSLDGIASVSTSGGLDDLALNNRLTCAVLTSGGIDCWGDGQYGQLGNGSTSNDSVIPQPVSAVGGSGPLSGVAAATIAPSGDNVCALLTAGGVDCWGLGNAGLGNGTGTGPNECDGGVVSCSTTPSSVLSTTGSGSLGSVTELSATGEYYLSESSYTSDVAFCGVLGTGGVDCWGQVDALGEGPVDGGPSSATPIAVPGIGGNGAITGVTGLAHVEDTADTCAARTDGGVDCWGTDLDGQLGDGPSGSSSFFPVAVWSAS